MLDIRGPEAIPDTKIYFSHSVLPSYIDPQNVSTKKKPFSTFNKQRFSHSLDLILPEEIYKLIQEQIARTDGPARAQYARVHMKLGDILESEFLDGYIKQGNIAMLSEGRPLVDNCFELYEGTLRMELDRRTYERCGLQGVPIEDGGKKHQKQRWILEFDLRDKAMRHGKKAFSRLAWACKNVLDQSLTWLFYNFNPSSAEAMAEGKEVISKHAPWLHEITPSPHILEKVLVPRVSVGDLTSLYDEGDALGLLEYLQMLSLDSPRLHQTDNMDPYLARYEVPEFGKGVAILNVHRVRWIGFIPPSFMRDLFIVLRREGLRFVKGKVNDTQDVQMEAHGDFEKGQKVQTDENETRWFSLSAQAFGGKNAWTVMQFAGRETLVWEIDS